MPSNKVRRSPPPRRPVGRPPLPQFPPHPAGLCCDELCPDCQDARGVLSLPAAALREFLRRAA